MEGGDISKGMGYEQAFIKGHKRSSKEGVRLVRGHLWLKSVGKWSQSYNEVK